MPEAYKQCGCCKQVLPLAAFNKHKRRRDGLQCECRDCQRAWYLAHRDEQLQRMRERHARERHAITEWTEHLKLTGT